MKIAALCVTVLLTVGCDVKVTPVENKVAAATPITEPAPVITAEQLRVSYTDFTLQKSPALSISGDLRPFYKISGRFTNTSAYTMTGIRIVVVITDKKGNKKDSAVVDLKMNVPPGEAQTFTQLFQILPPTEKWEWNYYVEDIQASR